MPDDEAELNTLLQNSDIARWWRRRSVFAAGLHDAFAQLDNQGDIEPTDDSNISEHGLSKVISFRPRSFVQVAVVAAALCIAILVAYWSVGTESVQKDTQIITAQQWFIHEQPITADTRTLNANEVLTDNRGARITSAQGAVIRRDANRDITLTNGALDVTAQAGNYSAHNPLRIATPRFTTEVRGTAYHLAHDTWRTWCQVDEGRVWINWQTGHAELSAGQQALFFAEHQQPILLPVMQATKPVELSWRGVNGLSDIQDNEQMVLRSHNGERGLMAASIDDLSSYRFQCVMNVDIRGNSGLAGIQFSTNTQDSFTQFSLREDAKQGTLNFSWRRWGYRTDTNRRELLTQYSWPSAGVAPFTVTVEQQAYQDGRVWTIETESSDGVRTQYALADDALAPIRTLRLVASGGAATFGSPKMWVLE